MSFWKKSQIRFDGQKEVESRIRNQIDNVISRRFKILMVAVGVLGVLLLTRLFLTQINQKEYYTTKLSQYNTSTFTTDTFRGNIYDRNYNRLVYNKNINCATYYAVKDITDEEIDMIVKFLIEHIHIDIESVTTRDKKDYLIMKMTKEKTIQQLLSDEDNQGDVDTIYKRQLNAITDEMLEKDLSDYDIKYYMLHYKIQSCYTGSVVLIEGLSVREASIIGENSDILRGIKVTNDWSREYTYQNNFKSVLGKVTTKKEGLPASNKEMLLALGYNNDSRVGVSGIEAQYESLLSGEDAIYSIEYDDSGNPIVKSVSSGSKGDNIRLTIDWDIQSALSEKVEEALKAHTGGMEKYNNNIYVVMMNPNNGEIIAMVGKRRDTNDGEIYDYAAGAYLNAYAIGSCFKGATLYTGFKNGVLQPGEVIVDKPLKIKGTATKASWNRNGLGALTDVQALAKSSNVYMWHVAIRLGGGTYVENGPLILQPEAFDLMRQCVGELGLGVKTGIDVPTEALGVRGKITSRDTGNLLDFAIGQYDTYTPIQMVQYVSTIANGGKRIQPHLFLDSFTENADGINQTLSHYKINILDDVSDQKTAFERIQLGFREGVVSGLASGVNGSYQPAGKTGTAQVFEYVNGKRIEYANRTFVGYAPYDEPEIAVACVAEEQYANPSCESLSKFAFEKYFEKYGVKSEDSND